MENSLVPQLTWETKFMQKYELLVDSMFVSDRCSAGAVCVPRE